jgi:ABC-type cobalt transport system, permease component cbiQ and related transporters
MAAPFSTELFHNKWHLDPRTKFYMLLIGTVDLFLAPTLYYEISLVSFISIFGLMCGVKRFTLKMTGIYTVLMILYQMGIHRMSGWMQIAVVTFTFYIRKIFPCAMMGGILVGTTRVNEFMAAMNRIYLSKSITIPMTVMIRYIPMVREDWGFIHDAMRMRDVAPTVRSLLTHPIRTVECIYVPMMMSALKVADELSAASITRGLENPKQRSCMVDLRFTWKDFAVAFSFTVFFVISILFMIGRNQS